MHELTERELYQALEYAKRIDAETGKKILIDFEADQTVLSRALFNIFPMIIAEQNRDMANLFMDLCFDVICVYKKMFGNPPRSSSDPSWLEKQSALLDSVVLSQIPAQPMDEKTRSTLQDRLIKRSNEETRQRGLIKFLNEAIDDYASECPSRVHAIKLTQAMIYVVVRLFNSLYSQKAKENAE